MSPQPPPYGALIEQARDDAGLSVREAARRAGISDAWWRYVASGRQGNNPVTGPADTVAAMARVVGVDPDSLAGKGKRPDAAEVLRALLEHEAAAPALEPEPSAVPAAGPDPGDSAQVLFPGGDKLSEALRAAWRLPQPEDVRVNMIAVIRAIWKLPSSEGERLELIRGVLATSPGSGYGGRSETA